MMINNNTKGNYGALKIIMVLCIIVLIAYKLRVVYYTRFVDPGILHHTCLACVGYRVHGPFLSGVFSAHCIKAAGVPITTGKPVSFHDVPHSRTLHLLELLCVNCCETHLTLTILRYMK